MTLKSFFIVWNPQGRNPPSYRHGTEEQAIKEAMRLAAEHPTQTFYVMECRGRAFKTDVHYEEAAPPDQFNEDEIPF